MAPITLKIDSANRTITFRMEEFGGLDHVVSLAREGGLAAYEEPYPALAAGLVQALPGDVLDVGANTGLFSLLAAASRPGVKVHAFEPLLPIRVRLKHNIAINAEIGASIDIYDSALSDKTGEAVFFETINPYGLLSTSSGLDEEFSRQHSATREHCVPTSTLDAWIAAQGVTEISFIKIDVEGHERAVLTGATNTAHSLRPVIGIELLAGADFEYFKKFLAEHDFLDCAMTTTALTVGSRPQFVEGGWNHLFVPSERLPVVVHVAAQAGLAVLQA